MNLDEIINRLTQSYPGQCQLIEQLCTLAATTPPSCIHIHTPFSPRPITKLAHSALDAVQARYVSISGVECLSQKVFFDTILNGLAEWEVQWEEGCETFGVGRYSRTLTGFVEGLRVISRKHLGDDGNMFIVIDKAERFKENLPELVVPMTRLADSSGLPITVVFLSSITWFEFRPLNGTAIDPFLMNTLGASKEDAISRLLSLFPIHESPPINTYSPALRPLYAHYVSALHSIVSPFIADDYELSYIAAACWPGFVSPILANWRAQLDTQAEDAMDQDDEIQPGSTFSLPSEEARLRLIRYFSPSFKRALEEIYPRTLHALEWTRSSAPPSELRLDELPIRSEEEQIWNGRGEKDNSLSTPGMVAREMNARPQLTTIAKFVLVGAFLASANPPKTDTRFIGRTSDERRKRRGVRPRKSTGGTAKVPQRLLGPTAFPIDRLIAIVGSLMEEHDEDGPRLRINADDAEEDQDAEKDTEMAVGGVQVSGTVSELVTMGLLHRTTPADKLDGPPSFKCGITQAHAFELSRELGISTLADLLWDPNS